MPDRVSAPVCCQDYKIHDVSKYLGVLRPVNHYGYIRASKTCRLQRSNYTHMNGRQPTSQYRANHHPSVTVPASPATPGVYTLLTNDQLFSRCCTIVIGLWLMVFTCVITMYPCLFFYLCTGLCLITLITCVIVMSFKGHQY